MCHHPDNDGIPLDCPACGQTFDYAVRQFTADGELYCPYGHTRFLCHTRELFAALRHIHRLVS